MKNDIKMKTTPLDDILKKEMVDPNFLGTYSKELKRLRRNRKIKANIKDGLVVILGLAALGLVLTLLIVGLTAPMQ